MPPPKKKLKMTETNRSPNDFVSFEQFKKLVENLSDICFEVQRDRVAGEGRKTLDECAHWYYEYFYRDPAVRKKYPCRLRACPMKIRDKLLRMPESKKGAPEPVSGLQTQWVMVKVAKNGTFLFPVSFSTFESCVDVEQVLRVMGKTTEQRQKLLADEKLWQAKLKKFYNMFYMFPDRPAANIFRNVSLLLLSQLLKHGKPNDDISERSVAKHAAEKKRPSIVSFAVFERNLSNIYDIVWQLKLHDRNYAALDFEKCAQALYLAFYLKLEIRDKYTFKWGTSNPAMIKRLLTVPNEKEADELRRSMPHLDPHTPEMELEEVIEIPDSQPEEPRPTADNLSERTPHSLPEEPRPLADNLSERTTEENNNNSLEKQPYASEPTLITTQGVAYEYPVTYDCFQQFVNSDEVLLQIRATHNATILSRSDGDLMQGLYLSFYTNEEIRKQFKCSFNAAPPALRKKLLAMAKPVIHSENQEVTDAMAKPVNQPQNQVGNVTDDEDTPPKEGVHLASSEEFPFLFLEESSQSSEEEPFQTDVEVNVGKDGRFLYPVSFDTFRRCINYTEIILPVLMLAVKDKSQLAGLVTHPRNPLCEKIFRRYYRSFYIFRDVREKYPYRFSCSDSSVLKKLVEYAKPLDENATRTMEKAKTKWEKATNVVDAPQSKKDKAKEDGAGTVKAMAATVLPQKSQNLKPLEIEKLKKSESRECNNQRGKESEEKSPNRPPFPVTFHVFKRYVKNFNEILQKMQLCNEYKEISEAELAEEYYKGFYTSPEMRQKFECKFRPCPAKKRDLLLSYAQKPQLEASSEVDVELVPEVGLDNCNNLVEKGRKEAIPVEPISVPVEESKEAADKVESSPESDCDVCLDNCNNIVEKGSKEAASLPTIPVERISVPVEESKEAANKEESLQESEFDVEFVPDVSSNNCNNVEVTESKEATKYPEKPTSVPVEQIIDATDTEEKSVKEKSVNPVSFQIFKRYVSNLKEIVNRMLLCEENKEKSEEECARDYYNGFYSSQEMRDRFPYQLKPCPAQMRNKLLSFPKKEREDQPREEDNQNGGISAEKQSEQCAPASGSEEIILITDSEDVEMEPCDIPVHTEEPSRQNQTSNNPQQTEAALNQKSSENPSNVSKRKNIRTFKDGGSFEFPVSYETFKRHINYDEIIKRLLQADSNNESEEPADRGQRLFRQFFNSFYVQKEVRKSHPYRFQSADAELLKKLEEYAVPLNEVAKLTMSSQAPEGEGQPWTVPSVPKDDTLVTLAGITYRFPVSFQTFHRYINYDELKVGLAKGPGPAKKSPEQLAAILADETSCLRLLRSYYYSFYTLKMIRNKLKYNFSAAPPELVEKLLEFAKPIAEAAEPASQPYLEPQPQPKQGVPVVTGQPPVTLSVFLNFMDLEDVVRGMQQEPEYSKLEADECKLRFYLEFYSNPSIRDKYPFKLRPCPAKVRERLLTLPSQSVDLNHSVNRDPDEMYASRQAELAGKQRINVVSYRPCDLRQYIDRRIAMPRKQDLLERHILDSRKAMNAPKNTPSPEESPVSMSKGTDPVAEVETSAEVKVPKESQSVKSSNLVSVSNEKTTSSSFRNKEQAEASREPSKPNSEKPLENTQNNPKSSADLPRPSTSSSTLRVQEETKNNRKENEPKECSELEERANSTSKKNKEANATNSSKENRAQKNSVQISASERSASTTGKKNDRGKAGNKPPAEASRNVSLPDSAKTLEISENNPKSSADMPGPSTSSSTLRVTDETQAKRKENEPRKCSELEETTNSTGKKNKEANATKESPTVTKEGKAVNSTKDNKAQKNSVQVSKSERSASTTSKKNDGEKARNKPPAKASRDVSLPDSAKTLENTQSNQKSSAGMPGPSTSSSTLRVTDETQAKRKENEPKECSELEERTDSTRNKNKEATTTKKSPTVTKKVTEANSTKEKEAQKSSEQVSVTKDTSSTTSKKNDGEKPTNKPPAEASKTLRLPDSANLTKSKPNNPKNSSDIQEPATLGNAQNPEKSQDKRGAPTEEGTGTNSGASSKSAPSPNTSQRQTEREIILEQAKAEFFAASTQDHNMTYLICTSQGLKRAVWRILYQLTLEEFKTYTSIHKGEDLYGNEEDLQPYYQHVVDKGNWPINLYIRLPMLRQLLHSKGVQLGTLDLTQLSPKMLHWRELDEHTDFDKIVEMQFTEHTGEEIDSVEQWFEEREQFYAACWRHDQWIYEVPQITNEALHDEVLDGELPDLDGIVLKPLHIVESCDLNSQTEILSITSSSDMVPDSQSCPPTQLSAPSFVDIASVDIQSQVPETPLDPLALQPEKLISVKQEPIKFLNNLRGICNTDECHWEHITSEEQIVNLDASQEEAPSLSCFAIPKPSEWISPNHSLDALLTATMFEDEEPQPGKNASNESIELPEHPAEEAQEPVKLEKPDEQPAVSETNVIQPQITLANPATRKKKLPASNAVPSKRARLGNEKVPQLRHEFRPLPLNACVRIETDMLGTDDPPTEAPPDTAMPQPDLPPTEAPSPPATLTPSQDFALGNTILESSQLTALLDALPRSTSVRKVNEKEPANENMVRVTAPTPRVIPPPLRTNVIFRKLERFLFFNPLTNQHIGRYMIQVPIQGATYQSAMLKVDGRVCQVRGPLLETLFPHLSPLLRSDLERVLRDMPEFVYSCRWWRVLQDNTEDLRKRVLYAFMDMAPEFGQFRLHFDGCEWATCIEIGRWDFEVPEKRPRCSNVAEKVIRPGILEKMREFKDMLR